MAGVSPFFQSMVNEDQGINRFFYKTITLAPMLPEEATDLIETKLSLVAEEAEKSGIGVTIDPQIVARVVALSGGHPHLLQLLGSHLVEHEEEDPDGVIDAMDLMNSLKRICYEDRARVYDSTLHMLEVHNKLDTMRILMGHMSRGFPTRIDRKTAAKHVGPEAIEWFVERNVLSVRSAESYGLIDEFLRIRLLLDQAESVAKQEQLEDDIIESALPEQLYFDEPSEDEDE